MQKLNFRKLIKRSDFSVVFGTVGKRRIIQDYRQSLSRAVKRTKSQWMRRSHQGWRNRVYGSIAAFKMRRLK